MKIIPALFAAGVAMLGFESPADATQTQDARYTVSTAQDALDLQNSLNDFRTFLRYGCADTRGTSGGSRLAGSFTICGSDAIESANHNNRRALVLSSIPQSSLQLYAGVDVYDVKQSKYRSRSDWLETALDRRDRVQAALATRASQNAALGQDDGVGRFQVATLGQDASEDGVSPDGQSGGGSQQLDGGIDIGDSATGGIGGIGGSGIHTATGGTVTEYTDGGTGSYGSGSVKHRNGVATRQDRGSSAGVAVGGDGSIVANDAVSAEGFSPDGVAVSDALVIDGEEVVIASEDGVPSPSESFFVQVDTDGTGAGGVQSDVPLPAALPLLAAALAGLGAMRNRKTAQVK